MYNYYNEKPLFDQNLVACNHSNAQPLMFPDEMFCNENPTWSSIVIANIVFASFGIILFFSMVSPPKLTFPSIVSFYEMQSLYEKGSIIQTMTEQKEP